MQLDSCIIQLDVYDKYILASTTTRTYLCDTELSQFRQIGKKLRDGNYGACFFHKTSDYESDVKIYCARPGCRLWEVNFDAQVIRTHQFRESLTITSSDVIRYTEDDKTPLEIIKSSDVTPPSSFSIEKVFQFSDFLVTFGDCGVLIFDVESAKLACWSDYLKSIQKMKILDNIMYIWSLDVEMRCITFVHLKSFLVKLFESGEYGRCGDICGVFSDDVIELMQKDDVVRKMFETNEIRLGNKVNEKIKVVLENFCLNNEKVMKNNTIDSEKVKEFNQTEERKCPIVKHDDEHLKSKEDILMMLYAQYQINKLNANAKIPKLLNALSEKNLVDIPNLFIELSKFISCTSPNIEIKAVTTWTNNYLLRYIAKHRLNEMESLSPNCDAFQVICDVFVKINSNDFGCCICKYPIPCTKIKIHYYNVGCVIIKKLWPQEYWRITQNVPQMFVYVLGTLQTDEQAITLLPLLIQYGDTEILDKYSRKFTYDMWDDAIKLLIKLKRGTCLNCDKEISFEERNSLPWSSFGSLAVKHLGGPTAINLLKKYVKYIHSGALNAWFYQTCIFTTYMEDADQKCRSNVVDFINGVHKNEDQTKEVCLNY